MAVPSTPFPLGVMVGGPNGSDPAAQAQVTRQFDSFVDAMGAAPSFMNAFVDQRQAITDWAGNSSWTAWSWRQSPIAQNIIPVIGLPMATTADQGRQGAVFRAFAAGTHDEALRGIVKAWADQGYKTLYIRPGYEMNGDFTPWYAGADPQTRADWVAAFQHIATVVRAVPGANVKVVWNPNIQAGNTGSVPDLYPGDQYVDVIAGDIYSPIYPRDLYDWSRNDGSVVATFAEWVADPVNRTHYWTYPAANRWSPISDGQSNTFSLLDMIAFAKAHGKPIALAETGSGGDGVRGPVDDPAFPQWLAATLASAGVPIEFVNIWDLDPGDGNWDFTSAGAGKPLAAAAWAKYFGQPAAGSFSPTFVGNGTDAIMIDLSQDAFQANAQFTVAVDGVQVGGVQSVRAAHGAGQSQSFEVRGAFGAGSHNVRVSFLNDAYGGPGLDRNLYVDRVTYRGVAVDAKAGLYSNGSTTILLPDATAPVDRLVLRMSQDAYGAPARFLARLDGVLLADAQEVTSLHGGTGQAFAFSGRFGSGSHTLSVEFLNDAYGGASLDRNLYLDSVELNGRLVPGMAASLYSNGTATLTIPSLLGQTVADTVTLSLSEDAWAGDAICRVFIDGRQLGDTHPVISPRGLGQPTQLSFSGDYGPGPHLIKVAFINDAYGGVGKDRNLFVDTVHFNGQLVTNSSAALYSNGEAVFNTGSVGQFALNQIESPTTPIDVALMKNL